MLNLVDWRTVKFIYEFRWGFCENFRELENHWHQPKGCMEVGCGNHHPWKPLSMATTTHGNHHPWQQLYSELMGTRVLHQGPLRDELCPGKAPEEPTFLPTSAGPWGHDGSQLPESWVPPQEEEEGLSLLYNMRKSWTKWTKFTLLN